MNLPLVALFVFSYAACVNARLAADESSTAPTDAATQTPTISKQDGEFFEKSIRPLLVEKCYACHSAEADELEGGLLLDSRQGIAAGGTGGTVISGRDPEKSLLIQAVRWGDANLQMPPDGKLSAQQITALERWVSSSDAT